MDISFEEQSQVLVNLDKARSILKISKHDKITSGLKKRRIVESIDTAFHEVQILDTQPY